MMSVESAALVSTPLYSQPPSMSEADDDDGAVRSDGPEPGLMVPSP